MKKIIVLICVLFCITVIIAQPMRPQEPKYWQDILPRPNQKWIEDYGHGNEQQLAYTCARIINSYGAQQKQIAQLMERTKELKARIEALEALKDTIDGSDPNVPDS